MNIRCRLDDGRLFAVNSEPSDLLRVLLRDHAPATKEARFAKFVIERAVFAPMSREEFEKWHQWAEGVTA